MKREELTGKLVVRCSHITASVKQEIRPHSDGKGQTYGFRIKIYNNATNELELNEWQASMTYVYSRINLLNRVEKKRSEKRD